MQRYRKLLAHARPHAGAFLLIGVLSVFGSALVALQPWPMKLIVDSALQHQPWPAPFANFFHQSTQPPSTLFLVALLATAGLALAALHVLSDSWIAWIWTRVGRRMVFDLAEEMFARLQRRSILFHSRTSVGDTMSSIGRDSWGVYLLLDAAVISPLSAVLSVAGMAWLMARLDTSLAIVALLAAPLMVLASFLLGRPLRAAANLKREIEGRLASHLHQTLAGMPIVQAFVQEDREHERFQQFANAAIRAQQRSTLLGSFNSLSAGLVTTLGTAVILWLGSRRVLDGTLTVGSLLVFLVYLNSLQAQMKTFASTWTTVQGLTASLDRAVNILTTPAEIADAPNARDAGVLRGSVSFEHVQFGYDADVDLSRAVLKDVSFSVAPGETIAIVGPSGAGKTTLVNFIPRFFDPWNGRITLDGHAARDLTVASLRRNVALVLQEPFLAPISIADNIAFARPEASREEIEAAARSANAHEFIMRLPNGYDTILEERGSTLSGGERQRLSIARAILKDAPILILDEPTSALDAGTEQEILSALEHLMRDRTTFIIAHRLSTIRHADRILVLQEGRIAESGTHDELLAGKGVYARLHATQFGREPASAASPAGQTA